MAARVGLVAAALLVQADSAAQKGDQVHCIDDRAHLLNYDIEGEENDGSSLKGVSKAIISMVPSKEHAQHCANVGSTAKDPITPSGDKDFCYGANQGSDCQSAKSALPLKAGFECKDCYLSAHADAFYKLNYTLTHLNSVEVGLKDIHLRASASLHKALSGSKDLANGNVALPGSDNDITIINTLVGCPVCVKVDIKVKFPTSLDYDFNVDGNADLQAGAALDLNLGDNIIKYDGAAKNASGNGWSHQVNQPTVKVTPVVKADAHATGNAKLDIKTSFQVNVDNIVWYHLNMVPALTTTVTFHEKDLFHDNQVCVNGDAAFDMTQEANLDWKLLAWHVHDHWGPSNLYNWQKSGVISGCKSFNLPGNASTVIV